MKAHLMKPHNPWFTYCGREVDKNRGVGQQLVVYRSLTKWYRLNHWKCCRPCMMALDARFRAITAFARAKEEAAHEGSS